MRTDTSEQRGKNTDPPPLDATQNRQRSKSQLDAIHVSSDPDSDIDEVLRLIAEQACLATAATSAAIAIRHEEEIVCRAIAGPNTPDLGAALNISTGLSGACVRTRQAQYCEDTDSDFRVNAEACRRLQVRSVLVVPLLKKEELVGVFEIFSPLPQAFARHDLQNLQALAHVVLDTIEPPQAGPVSSLIETEPAESFVDVSPPAAPPASIVAQKESPIVKSLAPAPPKVEPVVSPPPKKKEEAPPAAATPLRPAPPAPSRVAASPVKPPETRPARESVAVQPPPPQPPKPAAKPSPAFLRAEEPAVQTFLSLPRDPHSSAQDPLPSLSEPHDREWMSTLLTIAVISLAVILGWMLGRAGWERAMSGRSHSSTPAAHAGAAPAPAESSNTADDSDPIPAGPMDRTPSSTDSHSARAASSPPRPEADASSNGGLTVYQGGKIIFQQNARNANSARNSSEPPPVEVSSQVASAHLVQRVEPVYPEVARENFVQGEVVLEAVIGKDGVVQELKPISGDPQLIAAAATAVQQWRFRPYAPQGKPVNFSTRFTVNFRLH